MLRFSMVFVACMAMGMLFGCLKDSVGDYCNKVEACLLEVGQGLSVNCTHNVNSKLERYDVLGCGLEYEDLLDCLSGLSCDTLLNEPLPVECAAKRNALNRCTIN